MISHLYTAVMIEDTKTDIFTILDSNKEAISSVHGDPDEEDDNGASSDESAHDSDGSEDLNSQSASDHEADKHDVSPRKEPTQEEEEADTIDDELKKEIIPNMFMTEVMSLVEIDFASRADARFCLDSVARLVG